MKEPREGDVFSRLERDMVHDLSAWRHEVVELFNTTYEAALEVQQSKSSGRSPLVNPASVQEMHLNVTYGLAEEWDELEDAPQPGEYMQIGGPVSWYDARGDEKVSPTMHLLLEGRHIYGNYVDWKILPNYEEMVRLSLEGSQSAPPSQARAFGLYLVIEDPTFTDQANNVLQIYKDEIYVPVHYERSRFVIYGNY